MSAKIINLNKARKDRSRSAKKQQAAQNAAKHGRSKSQVSQETQQTARDTVKLDGHKRDPDSPKKT